MFYNPTDKLSQNIGLCVGTLIGQNILAGEDAMVFGKIEKGNELGYSMVAKKGLVVFRYSASLAA